MHRLKFSIFILLVITVVVITKKYPFREISIDNESSQYVLGTVKESKEIFGDERTREVGLSDSIYLYQIYKIDDIDKLIISDNLELKKTSSTYMSDHNCKFLSSASFYTANYQHIGLFITDYKMVSKFKDNVLLNGVFSINDFGTARIESSYKGDNLKFAMQSGPLIKENGKYLKNKFNDKRGRRILVATTGSNELYFITLYEKESVYEGPSLNELSTLIFQVESNEGVTFSDILNLDGGSASLFVSDNVKLIEVSTSGGFICLKE